MHRRELRANAGRHALACVSSVLLLLASLSHAGTPHVEISLVNATARERQAQSLLQRLLDTHDLSPWLFTRTIRIEAGVIPHSHPVLTLNTLHNDNPDALLSTFIHEQLHHWLDRHPDAVAAAVAELRAEFPAIPVGGRDGARDARSSYEHLLINHLELHAVEVLLGTARADAIERDHYRALYPIVRAFRPRIAEIVERHALGCCDAAVP